MNDQNPVTALIPRLSVSILLFIGGFIVGIKLFGGGVTDGIIGGWIFGGMIWGWFYSGKWFPDAFSGSTARIFFRCFLTAVIAVIAMPIALIQLIIAIIKFAAARNTHNGENV